MGVRHRPSKKARIQTCFVHAKPRSGRRREAGGGISAGMAQSDFCAIKTGVLFITVVDFVMPSSVCSKACFQAATSCLTA